MKKYLLITILVTIILSWLMVSLSALEGTIDDFIFKLQFNYGDWIIPVTIVCYSFATGVIISICWTIISRLNKLFESR